MIKSVMKILCCVLFAVLPGLIFPAGGPEYAKLRPKLKKVHPRLFLTPETRKSFADDVKRLAMKDFEALKKHIDSLPDQPKLIPLAGTTKIQDGKMIFLKTVADQNQIVYGLQNGHAGLAAVEAVIAYFVTEDVKYREKALRYLCFANEVFALADRSQIMPEWYHYNRLCALIAYDWLYPELTNEQRRDIIVPLLKHIEHMQHVKYHKDRGGPQTGNYGELGLMWFAGIAGADDGFCDELAESLLERGYKHARAMMDFREESSGGSGVLASIAECYTFAHYPYATFNFLHTIQSGFGVDGTKYWEQMRDYPKSVAWMSIPYQGPRNALLSYGFGDAYHYNNNAIYGMFMLYTHMAQCIHFYGENPVARAIIAMLPQNYRNYNALKSQPFLPFVIRNFDPGANVCKDPVKTLDTGIAQSFPSFGLSVMRSGYGPLDTYVAFKGGAKFSTHMHYDENTFVLFKRDFLALDTGSRGNTPHHLLYYPQTIAHNGMLIRMEGERPAPYWYGGDKKRIPDSQMYGDGGMISNTKAVPIPLKTGELHADCGSDATLCYDVRKCKEAIRQFVYLKPDYCVVYDRVTSVSKDQQKVFLLHTKNEPALENGVWVAVAGGGKLFCRTILPKIPKVEIVGGKDKEFMVRGINYPTNSYAERTKNSPMSALGRYRLEISPATPAEKDCFLHVLQCSMGREEKMVPVKYFHDNKYDGVRLTTPDGIEFTVRFIRDGKPGGDIAVRKNGKPYYRQPLSTLPQKQGRNKKR